MDKHGVVDITTKITHSYGMTKLEFFESIRKLGGWQRGSNCKYIGFYHSIDAKNRECKYFNYRIRTGWWTAIASKEDYLDYIAEWYKANLRNQRRNGNISIK